MLIFAYSRIEEHHVYQKREKKHYATKANKFVLKMSLLGMVDNLGGGLISPLISYWFFLRYGVELKSLGFMFFLSYFLAAMSFLTAPIIARQIGVVRTMAFSHGLASLIWLCLPLAPTFTIAAALTIIRSYLAYMDNPLRSSFIMGVVRPEDRGSAAGFTTLSRQVPVAISPTISAYMMQAFALQRADLDRRLDCNCFTTAFFTSCSATSNRRKNKEPGPRRRQPKSWESSADLHRDAKLLMASRGIRAFAFSYLNVIFAIYLDRFGYTPVTIGIVYSVAYLSGAVLTALWGYLSDRYGRRKILMLLALLTIVSNAIFVFFSSLFFILLAVIIANVGAGGSGGGGSGGGPFNPVEEALLAEKCRRKIAIRFSPSILSSARSWAPSAPWPPACRNFSRSAGAGSRWPPTSRFSC